MQPCPWPFFLLSRETNDIRMYREWAWCLPRMCGCTSYLGAKCLHKKNSSDSETASGLSVLTLEVSQPTLMWLHQRSRVWVSCSIFSAEIEIRKTSRVLNARCLGWYTQHVPMLCFHVHSEIRRECQWDHNYQQGLVFRHLSLILYRLSFSAPTASWCWGIRIRLLSVVIVCVIHASKFFCKYHLLGLYGIWVISSYALLLQSNNWSMPRGRQATWSFSGTTAVLINIPAWGDAWLTIMQANCWIMVGHSLGAG